MNFVLPTDWVSAALMIYLGVATMALAYGLLYVGLRTTTGSAATVATLLEPVSAAFLAVLLLGERLAWAAWFALPPDPRRGRRTVAYPTRRR